MIEFVVPGKVCSNNRVTRRFGNRSVKSPEAQSYQQKVFQHSFAAAQKAKWEMPAACNVLIFAYNVRLDVDNIAKCALDGMNGAAYADDKCVTKLTIIKLKDHDGERLWITVYPCEALVRPKKVRAPKPAPGSGKRAKAAVRKRAA